MAPIMVKTFSRKMSLISLQPLRRWIIRDSSASGKLSRAPIGSESSACAFRIWPSSSFRPPLTVKYFDEDSIKCIVEDWPRRRMITTFNLSKPTGLLTTESGTADRSGISFNNSSVNASPSTAKLASEARNRIAPGPVSAHGEPSAEPTLSESKRISDHPRTFAFTQPTEKPA